jgi:hypothetical protein
MGRYEGREVKDSVQASGLKIKRPSLGSREA